METHIDWLSFSVIIGSGGIPEYGWAWEDVQWHIEQFLGADITAYLGGAGWEVGHGRPPYASSFRSTQRGLTVFWSGKVSHALVEFSGAGMLAIRQAGLETALLIAASQRATRIDIATDIATTVPPFEFAEARKSGRTTSRGSYTSNLGQTEYVGSRQSERFARVYRYKDPHPRSHLLRVEHEVKGDTARAAIAFLLANGVEELQADLGNRFGWCHAIWEPDRQTLSTLALPAKHRESAKTELWLRTQAAKGFKKLVQNGTIQDPAQWLTEVFLEPATK